MRFSLRTLIVATTSLGLLVGWVTIALQSADRERAEDIKQLKDAINKIPKNKQAELKKMLRGKK